MFLYDVQSRQPEWFSYLFIYLFFCYLAISFQTSVMPFLCFWFLLIISRLSLNLILDHAFFFYLDWEKNNSRVNVPRGSHDYPSPSLQTLIVGHRLTFGGPNSTLWWEVHFFFFFFGCLYITVYGDYTRPCDNARFETSRKTNHSTIIHLT